MECTSRGTIRIDARAVKKAQKLPRERPEVSHALLRILRSFCPRKSLEVLPLQRSVYTPHTVSKSPASAALWTMRQVLHSAVFLAPIAGTGGGGVPHPAQLCEGLLPRCPRRRIHQGQPRSVSREGRRGGHHCAAVRAAASRVTTADGTKETNSISVLGRISH